MPCVFPAKCRSFNSCVSYIPTLPSIVPMAKKLPQLLTAKADDVCNKSHNNFFNSVHLIDLFIFKQHLFYNNRNLKYVNFAELDIQTYWNKKPSITCKPIFWEVITKRKVKKFGKPLYKLLEQVPADIYFVHY